MTTKQQQIDLLWAALVRISDMEGQPEMNDHIFAERALAIVNALIRRGERK